MGVPLRSGFMGAIEPESWNQGGKGAVFVAKSSVIAIYALNSPIRSAFMPFLGGLSVCPSVMPYKVYPMGESIRDGTGANYPHLQSQL